MNNSRIGLLVGDSALMGHDCLSGESEGLYQTIPCYLEHRFV